MLAEARAAGHVRSICLVTADFAGIIRNGGIGTHFWLMARLLAARGWKVHVLFCGIADDDQMLREVPEQLASEGIAFSSLQDQPEPAWFTTQQFGGDHPTVVRSQWVLEALEELHREQRFDIIEFPDWGALGLRPIQARRAGLALLDVAMAVKLHSTTQWQREGNLALRAEARDLKMEYCERYAFEHAEIQLSPSNYMLGYVRSLDWRVRDDAAVAYPFPDREPVETVQRPDINAVAFFGRLERRKGLHIFLDALDALDVQLPALFLGKDTRIDGRLASEIIADRLGDRPFRIETELHREAALTELSTGDKLAVIASQSETFGFTVAECVANRIPFIAARTGGIPEVLRHPEAQRRWLFEPTSAGLTESLRRRLASPGDEELVLRREVAAASATQRWNDEVAATYERLADRPLPRPEPRSAEPPTVTVAVAHYNHGDHLGAALESLAAQTRPAEQVIVVDDGSTSESCLESFAKQEARYPDWTFLRQPNSGPGAARNLALAHATGSYFLPFDADNIATPELVATYLEAMERNPERAASTCHTLAFVEPEDIERGPYAFRYAPTGGPRVSAVLENVFGDTCAMFRTEALRAVDGFETERWSPHEDWETFVKMAVDGHDVDVVPRVLFYYRTDVGGRLQELSADPAMTFRQRRRMVDAFFADAELTRRERRDLWECLLAFDHLALYGIAGNAQYYQRQLDELRAWHDSEIADLDAWRQGQLEELRTHLTARLVEAETRAAAAEQALAARPKSHLVPTRVRPLLRRTRSAARKTAARMRSGQT